MGRMRELSKNYFQSSGHWERGKIWMAGKLASSHMQVILDCMVSEYKNTPLLLRVCTVLQRPRIPLRVETFIPSPGVVLPEVIPSLFPELTCTWGLMDAMIQIMDSPLLNLTMSRGSSQLQNSHWDQLRPLLHLHGKFSLCPILLV